MAEAKGKVAVVLGATGVVGSGAVHEFLRQGATVVAVSRTAAKLDELQKQASVLSHSWRMRARASLQSIALRRRAPACICDRHPVACEPLSSHVCSFTSWV